MVIPTQVVLLLYPQWLKLGYPLQTRFIYSLKIWLNRVFAEQNPHILHGLPRLNCELKLPYLVQQNT